MGSWNFSLAQPKTPANVIVLADLNDFQVSTAVSDTLAVDVLVNLMWMCPSPSNTPIYLQWQLAGAESYPGQRQAVQ
jgi:hypothetical protein